jgi:hypothetical protein
MAGLAANEYVKSLTKGLTFETSLPIVRGKGGAAFSVNVDGWGAALSKRSLFALPAELQCAAGFDGAESGPGSSRAFRITRYVRDSTDLDIATKGLAPQRVEREGQKAGGDDDCLGGDLCRSI